MANHLTFDQIFVDKLGGESVGLYLPDALGGLAAGVATVFGSLAGMYGRGPTSVPVVSG